MIERALDELETAAIAKESSKKKQEDTDKSVMRMNRDFQHSIQEDKGFQQLMLILNIRLEQQERGLDILNKTSASEIQGRGFEGYIMKKMEFEVEIKVLRSIVDTPKQYAQAADKLLESSKSPNPNGVTEEGLSGGKNE